MSQGCLICGLTTHLNRVQYRTFILEYSLIRIIGYLFGLGLTMATLLSFFAGVYLWRLNKQLPDHDHLADYAPPIMTRVHAADGDLIAEFAQEHRLFVPIGVIPKNLIQAFLSSEDKNFYEHKGVDGLGVVRAMIKNVSNITQGKRLEGATHRDGCLETLEKLNAQLNGNNWLFGAEARMVDYAILPFIRQCRIANSDWFDSQSQLEDLHRWLQNFLTSDIFNTVMHKYEVWKDEDEPVVFPPAH